MEILVQPRKERKKKVVQEQDLVSPWFGERPSDLEQIDSWVLERVMVSDPLLPSSPPPPDRLCHSLPAHPFLASGAGLNLL